MGLNLDLTKMLGVPPTVVCPGCAKVVRTLFESYDVECGTPTPVAGEWRLCFYCDECEHENEFLFKITGSFAWTGRPKI